jgi:hypothetical protein
MAKLLSRRIIAAARAKTDEAEAVTNLDAPPLDLLDAAEIAIEQGLAVHVSATYDALIALGYTPDNARREIRCTVNEAFAEHPNKKRLVAVDQSTASQPKR